MEQYLNQKLCKIPALVFVSQISYQISNIIYPISDIISNVRYSGVGTEEQGELYIAPQKFHPC